MNIAPSSAKREAKATAVEAALNSFEVVAREWFERYSTSWTPAYRRYMIQSLEKNIFPYMGNRPIGSITARVLLGVLRRVEEQDALSVVHRALRECGRMDTVSRYSRCHPRNVIIYTRSKLDTISRRFRYRSVIVLMPTRSAPDTDPPRIGCNPGAFLMPTPCVSVFAQMLVRIQAERQTAA